MEHDAKGYAPDAGERLLLQALLDKEDMARASAEIWLDRANLTLLNEGLRRLLPLLHEKMTGWGMDHPKLPEVRREYRRYWLASQRIQYQADQLVERLATLNVPLVLLKGAALGRTVYPSPALRPFSDLDLLLHPRDFQSAQDHLVSSGFTLESQSPHSSLLRHEDFPEIDLHRSPYHEAFAEPLVAPLFSRLVSLPHESGRLHRLGDEDQLLHTLAHGLRVNLVSPLRWTVDAALLLRRAGRSFNWDLLHQEAIRLDLVEVAARGLSLLGGLCPGEVDAGTVSALEKRRTAITSLWFSAEREWQGPSVVWGKARRNRGLLGSLGMFIGHYGAVVAQQGGGQLARKAFTRAGKIITGSIRK